MRERLINLGIDNEKLSEILKLHKEVIEEGYYAKSKYESLESQLLKLKQQVEERDLQIKELKKFEGGSKELQEKISELENINEAKSKEYENEIALERKRNLVRLALLEDENGKPHDANLVLDLFNLDNIAVSDGKITSGFREQNENLRKDKSFLFASNELKQKETVGWNIQGKVPSDGGKSKQDIQTNNYESYGKQLAKVKLGMLGINPKENKED